MTPYGIFIIFFRFCVNLGGNLLDLILGHQGDEMGLVLPPKLTQNRKVKSEE